MLIPWFSALEIIGIKLGLDQIRALVTALGHPERAFASVIIAGTNGKGSVTAMVERALRAAGYRTGRYTSPHLVHLEERFAIDGVDITAARLSATAARVEAAANHLPHPPSFFEATTALAFDAFREAAVDIAVLEVGLGGRLDATNVVTPVAAAITAIDFDHEQYLGHTIEAIAGEKAGVIKPGIDVVLARNPPAVVDVVARVCDEQHARLVRAWQDVDAEVTLADGRAQLDLITPRASYPTLRLGLRGRHQVDNAITAVRLLEAIDGRGDFSVPATAIRTGVEDVAWPGRLELVPWRGGQVLLDGAHNPAGATALASYLHDTYRRPVVCVVGVMKDKHVDAVIASLAPCASHFVFTAPDSPRASAPNDLLARARHVAPRVPSEAVASSMDALARARALGDPIVVAGSLYLVGEVRARIA